MIKICRNCNTKNFQVIKSGALVAPFFVYKVWGLNMSLNWNSKKINLLNKLTLGILKKVVPLGVLDAGICKNCGFYSTFNEIPEKDLSKLYEEYRSDSYNKEREKFEPGYIKNISKLIGTKSETLVRVNALMQYFETIKINHGIDIKKCRNALDWGGADGSLLPEFNPKCNKFVFEISNMKPVKGVEKKQKITKNDKYEYIQITHVLEHVSNPYKFLQKSLNHLSSGGFLYLEVPIEVENKDSIIEDALTKKINLTVHEHINKFTPKSLKALISAHNLYLVDMCEEDIDHKWCISKNLRAFAKKL